MTQDAIRLVHGHVVNIKAIPTREVSRIEIEIPVEFHAEVTRMLFGQDVLIMGAKLPAQTPYGFVAVDQAPGAVPDLAEAPETGSNEALPPTFPPSPSSVAHSAFSRLAAGTSAGAVSRGSASLDIVKWLGMHCASGSFQEFLGCRTEADTIERVRSICGVDSRADIPRNPTARSRFFNQIYHPYTRRAPGQQRL